MLCVCLKSLSFITKQVGTPIALFKVNHNQFTAHLQSTGYHGFPCTGLTCISQQRITCSSTLTPNHLRNYTKNTQ